MVCVVIGDEEGFAQNRLASAVGDSRKEISFGIVYQFFHRSQIFAERFQTFIPRFRTRWSRCLGPVSSWPLWRDMLGISGKLVDIPLPDGHGFEQFPDGIRQAGGPHTSQFGRNSFESRFPVEMGVASSEQAHNVLTQGLIVNQPSLRSENQASIGSLVSFGHTCRMLICA